MENPAPKPRILFLTVFLAFSQVATAQVFNGDLDLSSQSDVNSFNYSEITGNLVIGQQDSRNTPLTDISDISALASLNKVGGTLFIKKTQLTNLSGLDQLSSVKTLDIVANELLENIQALASLVTIREDLVIAVNPSLASLMGLENVTSIGGVLDIEANISLGNLKGLDNVQAVGSFVVIDENLQMQSLQGLESLESVGDFFRIGPDQPELKDLQALQRLTTIVGNFHINELRKVTNLLGLNNLKSVESLSITGNPVLENLIGLESLLSTNDILIQNNHNLLNLQGLDNLLSVLSLQVLFNPSLQDLTGLTSLTTAIDIIIEGNQSLISLKGMSIVAVKQLFNITENESLLSLEGLNDLVAVEGSSLVIGQNPQLTSLEALSSLEFAFNIVLFENNQLTSLKGLENLSAFRNLSIFNNPSLNHCCAINDLLLTRPSGDITIHTNGENCNSLNAVLQNCANLTSGFTLINADTDLDISELNQNNIPEVINLMETGDQLNIRADFATPVESVIFQLDDLEVMTENIFPYSLFGNNPPLDYFGRSLPLGRHTLIATAFPEKNGGGTPMERMSIELMVIDAPMAVTSFTIVSPADNSDRVELTEGAVILTESNANGINIRANTHGPVGSVVFDLKSTQGFRVENVTPYALGGDFPAGNYNNTPEITSPGFYTLTATPYTLPSGTGNPGSSLSVTFSVVDNTTANLRTESAAEPLELRFYPNPTQRWLNLQRNDLSVNTLELTLFDPLGEIIWQHLLTETSARFDLGNLPTNVYFLRVKSSQHFRMHRLLIE